MSVLVAGGLAGGLVIEYGFVAEFAGVIGAPVTASSILNPIQVCRPPHLPCWGACNLAMWECMPAPEPCQKVAHGRRTVAPTLSAATAALRCALLRPSLVSRTPAASKVTAAAGGTAPQHGSHTPRAPSSATRTSSATAQVVCLVREVSTQKVSHVSLEGLRSTWMRF